MSEAKRPVVLLVDDEALIVTTLGLVLRERGFDVLEAFSGEAALVLLNDNAIADNVGILITDVQLGRDRIDGWEFAKQVRQRIPVIPVIYVTGDSGHEWSIRGLPGSVLLGKPFDNELFVQAVWGMLGATASPCVDPRSAPG